MKHSMRVIALLFSFIALAALGLVAAPAWAAEQSAEELAKAAQNPVANMISLPFQNNTNFNVGPENGVQNVLNIQPVIPISLAHKLESDHPHHIPGHLPAPLWTGAEHPIRPGRHFFFGVPFPRQARGILLGSGSHSPVAYPYERPAGIHPLGPRSHGRGPAHRRSLVVRRPGQQCLVSGRQRPRTVQ